MLQRFIYWIIHLFDTKPDYRVRIEVMDDKKGWILHKQYPGINDEEEWYTASAEVVELNKHNERLYRAIVSTPSGLTYIHCRGTYVKPTRTLGW